MYINDKTMLLLHSEDFTDNSYHNVPISNTNCVVVDNGKFGKAIDYGNNGYVTWNLPNNYNCKGLTVDFWVYLKSHTTYPTIFSTNNSNDTRGLYCHFVSNKLKVNLTNYEQIGTEYTFPLNTWKHIAVTVDNSSNVSLFVDGIKEASRIIDKNVDFNKFIIGALLHSNSVDGATYSNCIVDEFRITEGVLYTQNFTPNAEPYKKTSVDIIESSLQKVAFKVDGICDKVQLVINGNLVCEYTDISQIIEYDIPLNNIIAGDNDIYIKVIIGNVFVLKNIRLTNSLVNLPNDSTLEDVVDRFDIMSNTCRRLNLDLKNNLVVKGVEVLPTDKMSNLIDKVAEIPLGKKFASGTIIGSSITSTVSVSLLNGSTYTAKTININNLGFKPSVVVFYNPNLVNGIADTNKHFCVLNNDISFFGLSSTNFTWTGNLYTTFRKNLYDGGFDIILINTTVAGDYYWIAYE